MAETPRVCHSNPIVDSLRNKSKYDMALQLGMHPDTLAATRAAAKTTLAVRTRIDNAGYKDRFLTHAYHRSNGTSLPLCVDQSWSLGQDEGEVLGEEAR